MTIAERTSLVALPVFSWNSKAIANEHLVRETGEEIIEYMKVPFVIVMRDHTRFLQEIFFQMSYGERDLDLDRAKHENYLREHCRPARNGFPDICRTDWN